MSNIVFFDSTSPKDLLIELCEEASRDDMPGSQNLSLVDWEYEPATLLYKIYIEKVYDESNRGKFIGILDEDGKLLMVFGGMRWDQNHSVCLMPTRLYLRQDVRNFGEKGNTTFTARYKDAVIRMNEEFIRMGYKATIITHNDYNIRFRAHTYNISREEGYMIFDYYDDPVIINHTRQWAMYHMYDESYRDELIKSLDKVKSKS